MPLPVPIDLAAQALTAAAPAVNLAPAAASIAPLALGGAAAYAGSKLLPQLFNSLAANSLAKAMPVRTLMPPLRHTPEGEPLYPRPIYSLNDELLPDDLTAEELAKLPNPETGDVDAFSRVARNALNINGDYLSSDTRKRIIAESALRNPNAYGKYSIIHHDGSESGGFNSAYREYPGLVSVLDYTAPSDSPERYRTVFDPSQFTDEEQISEMLDTSRVLNNIAWDASNVPQFSYRTPPRPDHKNTALGRWYAAHGNRIPITVDDIDLPF